MPVPTLETLLDTSVLSDWADTTFGGFTRAGITSYIPVVGGAHEKQWESVVQSLAA